MNRQYITAAEIAEAIGVSIGKAYAIIRELNGELKAQGYITISGKCPVAYFEKKYFGFKRAAGD